MRVLQILPSMHVGGVETGTLDLARALVRLEHQAYVVSSGGDLVPELIKAGVTHITLPVHKKSIVSLGLIPKLRNIIEHERIDIVHARSRVPALLAYWATRRTSARFVTTCHGFYSDHAFSRVMGWGQRVIVTSGVIGRRMIDTFGVDPGRIRLVYRGVDLSRFTYVENKYGDRNGKEHKRIVACVGRISPIKGIDDFIKAVAILSRTRSDVEAWIVGGPGRKSGAYLELLKGLVARLGLEATVKFIGLRRDIPDLMNRIDVLVMPSRVPESFGRVLVEAGASGTAVVATKLGGALDIIDENETGLFIPPANPSHMARAVSALLDDASLANRISSNLERKVRTCFSLDKMAADTVEVYREVRKDSRILIIKLGALGDIVLATPTLRMVRRRYPNARISVLVDRRFQDILEQCPYVDEIIPIGRDDSWKTLSGFLRSLGRIRRQGFDISIDLQNTSKTHLAAFLAGIPTRAGYRRGGFGSLINRDGGTFKDRLPPVTHQFRVLKQVHVHEYDDTLELWPRPKARDFIEDRLREEWVSGGQRLVGFVLGASRRWVTKKWPLEYFLTLAEQLTQRMGVRIVLIGDESDCALAEAFKKKSSVRPVDLTGKTDLAQLVALVDRLDVLVTADSAPMHVASAVRTPLVALFGPTDPNRHAPPGEGHTILYKKVPCAPCYKTSCSVGHICMRNISVDEVFDSIAASIPVAI